jgi:hypothetical protein
MILTQAAPMARIAARQRQQEEHPEERYQDEFRGDNPVARTPLPDLYALLTVEQVRTGVITMLKHLPAEVQASITRSLMAKIDTSGGPDACHSFRASLTTAAYGKFNCDGRTVEASHLVCADTYGPLVTALHARHIRPGCARICCIWKHLFLGTERQNRDDRRLIPTPPVDPALDTNSLNHKARNWIRRMVDEGKDDVTLLSHSRRLSPADVALINARFARQAA